MVHKLVIGILFLTTTGCSLYTGEVRQCPKGWPQDVFNKIDEVKAVCTNTQK